MAQTVKHLPAVRETRVRSLGWEDPLEKEMATYSSTLAWKIAWTEEPGRLQSMGSQSWTWLSGFTFTFTKIIKCNHPLLKLLRQSFIISVCMLLLVTTELRPSNQWEYRFVRGEVWRRKWQPTPVFLPGESQGRGSLVGCCLWGRTESDTTEAT